MAGLVPVIHVVCDVQKEGLDARQEAGHDVLCWGDAVTERIFQFLKLIIRSTERRALPMIAGSTVTSSRM